MQPIATHNKLATHNKFNALAGTTPCHTCYLGNIQVYCRALVCSVATKKSCCSVAYRSALVARTLSRQTTPKPRCNITVLTCAYCTTLDTEILHNLCRVRQAAMRTWTADSVEQVATRNDMLQCLHRGSEDRLVSGHGDDFADRRHSSGGSRAHCVDEEQTISRPACRRHHMLPRTCWHDGMCRRLCAASLAACALCVRMGPCRVFPRKAFQPRVPRCAISHPARYPMASATCVRWRRKIGRAVVTDGRVRVWSGRQ